MHRFRSVLVFVSIFLGIQPAFAGLATEGIDGLWRGEWHQFNRPAVPFQLRVRNGTYLATFSAYNCSYTWTLTEETAGSATFRTHQASDPDNNCDDT
jgi:hypothetical protein